jgi:hypothetical protein
MVQWSNGHILFGLSSGPKTTVDQSRKGPKKFPIHIVGHCFVTCVRVCVCVRFSPLAEKLCSTNHKPLFSEPNKIHPIHILLTLILSIGPNSSFH